MKGIAATFLREKTRGAKLTVRQRKNWDRKEPGGSSQEGANPWGGGVNR